MAASSSSTSDSGKAGGGDLFDEFVLPKTYSMLPHNCHNQCPTYFGAGLQGRGGGEDLFGEHYCGEGRGCGYERGGRVGHDVMSL